MKYASVCSGVEAASLAFETLGWEPAWFSEIDAFPSAVLSYRYPNVPNLGDMTKIKCLDNQKGIFQYGTDGVIQEFGRIDLLVGGTPCQSFSTAGTRTGLQGVSGLALTYCELLKSMRPTWFLWENVPGCLSSANGEDFKTILKAFDEIGYSCAWRVLDAQYCRVDGFPRAIPQRRRRVFVVGHSSGDWRHPAEVLFEPSCLPRTTPPCRVKGKGYREGIEGSIGTTGESVKGTLLSVHGAQTPITSEGFAHPLGARNLGLENCLYESRCVNPHFNCHESSEVCDTLAATDHKNNLAVRVVGVDGYNQTITNDVSCSVTTSSGHVNATGPKVMSLYEEQK